jgi:hypothetical protein
MPGAFLSSELVVTKSVNILGAGAANLTVDGNLTGRVFRISPNHTVSIEGLTITKGAAIYGGGIHIFQSSLTLRKCTIRDNSAGQEGGGIFNHGTNVAETTLNVIDSTLSGNSAAIAGAGIYNRQPGSAQNSATVTNSTLSANFSEGAAGAIYNDDGALTVVNSTVSGNSAFTTGGIGNSGTLVVASSTFSGNLDGLGTAGAIHNTGRMEIGNTVLRPVPMAQISRITASFRPAGSISAVTTVAAS